MTRSVKSMTDAVKLILLDRDGTLIEKRKPYVLKLDGVKLAEALETLGVDCRFNRIGYKWNSIIYSAFYDKDFYINNGITSSRHSDLVIAHNCHKAAVEAMSEHFGLGYALYKKFQRKNRRILKMEKEVYAENPLVVATSKGTAKELKEHYDVDAKVIAGGVDADFFKPDKYRLRRPPTAVWIGYEPRRKGLNEAIRICEKAGFLLNVIGIEKKDTDTVIYYGKVANEKLPMHYGFADVFLLPSVHEGFCMASLEAAACGLPILMPKVNGAEELIIEGGTGFFLRDWGNNYGAMWVAHHSRAEMGRNARKKVLKEYTWDKVAGKYEKLIKGEK